MAATAEAKLVISAQDKTEQAFRSIEASFAKLQAGAATLSKGVGVLFAGAAALGLVSFGKAAIDVADQINDMSDKTGIAGENLSALAYAAKMSGSDIEGLATGLKILSKNMAEAAGDKTSELGRTFDMIGVSVLDANLKLRSSEGVLSDLADKFASYENGPAKAALAMKIFGKSGEELIPFLNNGSAGIKELTDKARELGVVLDQETIQRSADFNDQVDTLKIKLDTMAAQIASGLLPALTKLAEVFSTAGSSTNDLRSFGEDAAVVIGYITDVAMKAVQGIMALSGSFKVVAADLDVFFTNRVTNKAGYEKALAERNKILQDANNAYAKFWYDPIDKYSKAVLSIQAANKALANSPDVSGSDHRFNSLAKGADKPKVQAPVLPKDDSAARLAAAKKAADEAAKLARATADAQFNMLKDALDRQMKELDAALEDNLVSIRDYWALRTIETQKGIDAEIAAKQAEWEASEPDQRKKLEAEIAILQRTRAQAGVDGARAQEKAVKALNDEIAKTRDELLDLTGASTEADRRAAIERQYQPLVDKMKANGQDTAGVTRLIDVKAAKADLDQLQSQYTDAMEQMRLAEERVQLDKDAGLITEMEMRQRLNDLHRQTAVEVDALIPKMRELAGVIGGPEGSRQVANIERLQLEQQKLKQTTNELSLAMQNSFSSSLSTLFQDVVNKSSSASAAFLSFCNSIAQAWQKAVADIMAQQLTNSVFKLVSAYFAGGTDMAGGAESGVTSDYGGASGSDYGEYYDGGYTGDGGKYDPAGIVHKGEHVTRSEVVRQPGVRGFLAALNRYGASALNRLSGYSGGGLVGMVDALSSLERGPRGSASQLSISAEGLAEGRSSGSGGVSSIGMFNYFDPDMLVQAMASNRQFEKLIVNHAIANGGTIQKGWKS